MLSIQSLSVAFRRQSSASDTVVVHDLSFTIKQGEAIALTGESGSGKSVSALSILGLLPYPTAYHPKGSIVFEGQELLNQKPSLLRQYRGSEIGFVFQEPMTALNPLHSIERQIAEPLKIHTQWHRRKIRDRVVEVLEQVGFPEGVHRLSALPHQLSGGQRQRVMIAMALVCGPKLLIADEPTTALDVSIQAGIIDLFKNLRQTHNMGLILISHDIEMVQRIADTIIVMKHGHVVEQGGTKTILSSPKDPYTRHLIDSKPSGHPRPISEAAKVILEGKSLSVSFPKTTGLFQKKAWIHAVSNVFLAVKQGETVGLVGESGSGKTTLAYALMRLQSITSGQILFENQSLETLTLRQLRPCRRHFQVIFQDPFSSLNPRMSAGESVAEGLVVHEKHLSREERDQKVIKIFEKVGLDSESRLRYPHEFSGGQRQRIAIARALILNPKVLILDEPTSALDRSVQAEVLTLLRHLQEEQGMAYLFISHDLNVIRAMSHRILVLYQGKVVEEGVTEEIITSPKHPYTQGLINAALKNLLLTHSITHWDSTV